MNSTEPVFCHCCEQYIGLWHWDHIVPCQYCPYFLKHPMYALQHLQKECLGLAPDQWVSYCRLPASAYQNIAKWNPHDALEQLHNHMQDNGILYQRDFLRVTPRQYYCPSYRGPPIFTFGPGFAIGGPLRESFAITQLGGTANYPEIRAWPTIPPLLNERQSTPKVLNGSGVANDASSRNGKALTNDAEATYEPVNTNGSSSRNRCPRSSKPSSSEHSTDGIGIAAVPAQFALDLPKEEANGSAALSALSMPPKINGALNEMGYSTKPSHPFPDRQSTSTSRSLCITSGKHARRCTGFEPFRGAK